MESDCCRNCCLRLAVSVESAAMCVSSRLRPSWLGTTSSSVVVSGQLSSLTQRSASFTSAYVYSAFCLVYFFVSLYGETGCRPPAKVSRSMTSDKVSGLTEFVFAHRRRKLQAYSPTDPVSPCWRLKNAPAKAEESRCSPQCYSRMANILAGVFTSSASMARISCLARPSKPPRSQPVATGSATSFS